MCNEKYRRTRGGIETANALLSHPYHIAAVTGDSILVEPTNFAARIAFVDYDGESAYRDYKLSPPKTPQQEEEFVTSLT